MAAPNFSVVITAYNEEELVGAAIGSVLAQTEADIELIVVDDGSEDATAEVVREFTSDSRLRLLSQENRGLSAARNAGVAAAGAELVAFLDSDDLFLPDYLERMGSALAERPDAGFAYTDAWLLDDEGDRFARPSAMSWNHPPADPPADPEAFLRLLIESNFIFVAATARRAALEAAGPFDESLSAVEDYDLWLRVLGAGFGAARVPGRPAIKRNRAGAMTTHHRNMYANLERVCRKVAESPDFSPQVRSAATARADSAASEVALLDGSAGPAAGTRAGLEGAARKLLAPLRKRGEWYEQTPSELQAAFPGGEWRRRKRP